MAKITFTIEDKPDGNVSVVSDPPASDILALIATGKDYTPAHGYAMTALNAIRKAGKSKGPMQVLVPRLKSLFKKS